MFKKNKYDKSKIMTEDKRKGKGVPRKYQKMKPYQEVNCDSQFRIPSKVEEDKKVSHKQVFGTTSSKKVKRQSQRKGKKK
jgi:hypothetical protein